MSKDKLFKIILSIILMLTVSVFSQSKNPNSASEDNIWISLGVGLGDDNIDYWQPFPSSGFSFNYTSGNKLFRLRYYNNILTRPFSEITKRIRDLGFLYGYRKELIRGAVSLSCGISLVSGYYYEWLGPDSGETYDRVGISAVGFPFEAQLDWSPFRKFGIGLSIFGDLNSEKSFYGAMLNFNIGKLR